jgi:rod shape determining protein RodA
MFQLLIPSFLLYIFSIFNLFGTKPTLVMNQIVFLVIGLLAFFIVRKIGLYFFEINSTFFYWFFVALLVLTFIIGLEAKGSKRWIDLFFFNFQPSEFFKIFFVIFLADFFTKHRRSVKEIGFYLASILLFIIPTLIIFKQPDLGNAMVYVFIFFTMLLFSGIPKKFIVYTLAIIVLCLPAMWPLLHGYQRDRVLSFINPHVDQKGTAYNMTQAIITIGSGNFTGRGLGLGTQSHLYFLPENHTDFAFSSLVEQFGFLGGVVVIILFGILAFFLVQKILRYYYRNDEESRFKFLVLVGFFAYFIFQTFINLGMNLGILPVAGIALPLISYGGSSLLTWMIAVALLP